jgi:hypothetical protein
VPVGIRHALSKVLGQLPSPLQLFLEELNEMFPGLVLAELVALL